jgi:hypothetical protein
MTTLLTFHAILTVSLFALLLLVIAGQGVVRLAVGMVRTFRPLARKDFRQDVQRGALSH